MARKPEKLDDVKSSVDDIFVGEATNPKSIEGICDKIDYVVTTLGITKQKDGLTYMDVDYQANLNILEEAKKSGVSRFQYVSVFGLERLKMLNVIQAKFKFGEALKASGVDYSIVYPNGFFSDMAQYLEMAKKGKIYLVGDGDYKINPIHGEDLAKTCLDALQTGEKEIEAGGPEVFTHKEIAFKAFETLGKKPRIGKIPIWQKNMLLWLLKIFTSVKTYGPMEFFLNVLATDMVAPKRGERRLSSFFAEKARRV